ncbi:MAG: guanylate kinase [Gammaproteobacteria bacterium]|nr:guanylate kinase [Gammaproteobacteria bacterium]
MPPVTPGTLFIISAPSGAGKTSLVRALLHEMPDLKLSISCTTRAPRTDEQPGEAYHFMDHAEFQRRLQANEFIEHAEVFGNYYGTLRSEVEQRLAQGIDVLLEIDWQGARLVRKTMPDCVGVFIFPPSRQDLERRLYSRKQDSDAAIQRRLAEAVGEMRHYDEFDYVVINDDFATALQDLLAVVRAARLSCGRQTRRHAEILAHLLA